MIIQQIPPVVLPGTPGTTRLIDDRAFEPLKFAYREGILSHEDCDPCLRDVLRYILETEGSFIRAQLGFDVMKVFGADDASAVSFGIACEWFHTASLVIDDLPSMDDATHRRGQVCPHIQFSEADAHLAALALIHHAYDRMFSLLDGQPAEVSRACRSHLTRCLGVQGILSGQSADIHYERSRLDGAAVSAIATGKTGALLGLILGFPALLYQAAPEISQSLLRLANAWGVAYQILDDFKDVLLEDRESGKTTCRDFELDRPNYVLSCGRASAWYRLNKELLEARNIIDRICFDYPDGSVLNPLQDQLTDGAERLMDCTVA